MTAVLRVLIRLAQAAMWLAGGLVLLAVAGLIWLLSTQNGARFALAEATARVPGLSIGAVDGSVFGGLSLVDVALHTPDGLSLQIDTAQLRLDWHAFWQGHLLVDSLVLTHLSLRLPAATAKQTATPPPDFANLSLALPVPVTLRRVQIQAAVVQDAAGQPLAEVPMLQMHAAADARTIRLSLERQSRVMLPSAGIGLDAAGAVSVAVAAPHALSGRGSWLLDAPDGWVPGAVALSGSLAEVQAQLDASVLGNWLDGALPPVSMSAALTVPLARAPERVEVSRLAIDALGGCLAGKGAFDGTTMTATAQLDWQGMDPSVLAPAAAGRLSGAMTADWQAARGATATVTNLTGEIGGVPLQALALQAGWDADTARLAITGGKIGGGALTADARYGLAAEHPLSATLDWSADAPSVLLHTATGSVTARGRVKLAVDGTLGADAPSTANLAAQATVDQGVLGSHGASLPLQATLRGAWQQGALQLDEVQAQLASVRLNAAGRLGFGAAARKTDQLRATLDAERLDRLPLTAFGLPALGGSLAADVSLHGAMNAPSGQLRLTGRRLALADWRLATVDVSAALDDWQQAKLQIAAQSLAERGAVQIKSLTLSAAGAVPELNTDGRQRLSLRVESAPATVSLSLDGRWQNDQWLGRLTDLHLAALRFDDKALPDWRLERTVPLEISASAQRLGHLCLRSADAARLCVAGEYAPAAGGQGGALLTANLPLMLAKPWLPAGLDAPGRLTLQGDATLRAGVPTASLALTLPKNSLRWPAMLGTAPLDYAPLTASARWRNELLTAEIHNDTPNLWRLNGSGQWAMTGAEPVSGKVALDLPKLDRLKFLLPMLAELSGRAEAQLTVSGTRRAPRMMGKASLDALAFALPDTGISYRAGVMNAEVNDQGALDFSGQITAVAPPDAGGTAKTTAAALHWAGTGTLANLPDWQIQARVDGEGVPFLRLPMLSVDASPALTLAASEAGATVDGQIGLPRVDARVASLPAGVVAPTEDLVIEGHAPPAAKPAGYPLRGKIALRLGDAVHLSGMGFSTALAGGLMLHLSENHPLSAQGEVRLVDGRYRAYGQDLVINPGRLLFVGPLTDPGLAVRAERVVGANTVGLNISGTLQKPKTAVFSNPSLPESDALSLLITGRTLDTASMSDGSVIKDAAVGLGIAQGDSVLRDLGERFGFSGLGLDTTGGLDGTRLSLGKQLNDRLFVRYAIGVFNGVGELITRYRLSRLFSIELTTSPEASGGDLIYQIE